ncbi:hypothetical protein Lal_00027869 [Lupinus albus]|nr:hypothetical protein Lal_00027869 [Lupinus albus]
MVSGPGAAIVKFKLSPLDSAYGCSPTSTMAYEKKSGRYTMSHDATISEPVTVAYAAQSKANGSSKRPITNLTRKILFTASSIRLMGMALLFTSKIRPNIIKRLEVRDIYHVNSSIDSGLNGICVVGMRRGMFVRTEKNLADPLTKGLTKDMVLKTSLGMRLKPMSN